MLRIYILLRSSNECDKANLAASLVGHSRNISNIQQEKIPTHLISLVNDIVDNRTNMRRRNDHIYMISDQIYNKEYNG